jgi:hypothetical protein
MRTSLRLAAVCLATVTASGFAAGAASAAPAAAPVDRLPFAQGPTASVLTDLCSFPVTVTGVQTGYQIIHTLPSGETQLIVHGTETDVFTANGKTLQGLPYTGTVQAIFDAAGNLVRFTSEGIVERVPLPEGGEFFAAGRIDWMLHPEAFTIINPDSGRLGNVAGLCAALA